MPAFSFYEVLYPLCSTGNNVDVDLIDWNDDLNDVHLGMI